MSKLDFGEHVYDYEQEKPYDLPDGSYVAAEDIPAIVATELERITEDGTGWAIATHLRRRAAELRGEQ